MLKSELEYNVNTDFEYNQNDPKKCSMAVIARSPKIVAFLEELHDKHILPIDLSPHRQDLLMSQPADFIAPVYWVEQCLSFMFATAFKNDELFNRLFWFDDFGDIDLSSRYSRTIEAQICIVEVTINNLSPDITPPDWLT